MKYIVLKEEVKGNKVILEEVNRFVGHLDMWKKILDLETREQRFDTRFIIQEDTEEKFIEYYR